MKSFDDYKDGEWVVYNNPGHLWHLMNFQAHKSQYTHNAFRLKFGDREIVADISEIEPISETNRLVQGPYENAHRHIQRSPNRSRFSEEDDDFSDIQD